MAAWPPPRGSATAARRISGSPRSRGPRRAPGMRRSRPSRRVQDAARSRARSRCARTNRAGRAPWRGAPGPCAIPGIASENLFSAWIEKLFDDPLDAEPSWPALHEVVRDPSRNFLFNHLGFNEDAKIYLRPDCADLPYTLRAYFAYKMGLPYGFSKCSRGGGGRAPTCPQWFSLQNAEAAKPPPPPPVAAPIAPAG